MFKISIMVLWYNSGWLKNCIMCCQIKCLYLYYIVEKVCSMGSYNFTELNGWTENLRMYAFRIIKKNREQGFFCSILKFSWWEPEFETSRCYLNPVRSMEWWLGNKPVIYDYFDYREYLNDVFSYFKKVDP